MGLGYDSHTDDYKVISVFQTRDVCLETCVYSMRENVWKLVKDESVLPKHSIQQSQGVGANGVLHFVGVTRESKPIFICFDVRTEGFFIVDYPELDCYDFSKMCISLRELRGCMCLLVNYQSKGVGMDDELCNRPLLYADVWEKRDGGNEVTWVKLFRIRKSEVVGKGTRCMYLRLVAYSKDKRKLLVEFDGAWFGWYDLVIKRVTRVKTYGVRDDDSPYVAMTYVESLVSLSNDKAVSVSKRGLMPKKTVDK